MESAIAGIMKTKTRNIGKKDADSGFWNYTRLLAKIYQGVLTSRNSNVHKLKVT
jgi:hypothetical protein